MSEVTENRIQENGQITYATEVISTIVTVATTEVEGISGITGGGAISGIITRGRTPRGVKVDVKGDRVSVDISVSVDYGIPIQKVGRNCQENVRKSIETMTGLKVERVDLHVVSVSFDKENRELDKGQRLALTLGGEGQEEKPAEAAGEAEEKPEEAVAETAEETPAAAEPEDTEEDDWEENGEPEEDPEDAPEDAPEETPEEASPEAAEEAETECEEKKPGQDGEETEDTASLYEEETEDAAEENDEEYDEEDDEEDGDFDKED